MKSLAAFHCLVIATISLPLSAQEVAQETPQKLFVADKLVLNVYAEPVQGSARVATIQTGDEVEELERSDNLIRVRLEDGREGWVGANYLVSDAPAIVRLRELQRQQPSIAPTIDKASIEELARLKKENTVLRGQVGELQARLSAPVAPPVEKETAAAAPTPETISQPISLASTAPHGSVWGWLVALMFVGAVSFASGYQTLARRLRKKFGALKIY